jgi:hypothetical protein
MSDLRDKFLFGHLNDKQKRNLRFIKRVQSGDPVSDEDLKSLADDLNAIMNGANPKETLGVSGIQSEGRPKGTNRQRFGKEIDPVIEVEKLRKYKGMKLEDALETVRESFGIPETTLERYQKKHRKFAQNFIEFIEANIKMLDVEGQEAGSLIKWFPDP